MMFSTLLTTPVTDGRLKVRTTRPLPAIPRDLDFAGEFALGAARGLAGAVCLVLTGFWLLLLGMLNMLRFGVQDDLVEPTFWINSALLGALTVGLVFCGLIMRAKRPARMRIAILTAAGAIVLGAWIAAGIFETPHVPGTGMDWNIEPRTDQLIWETLLAPASAMLAITAIVMPSTRRRNRKSS